MNVTTLLGTGLSPDFLAYDEALRRVTFAANHVYALTARYPTDILLGQRVYLILNHGMTLMPWLRSGDAEAPGALESIAGMRILIDPSFDNRIQPLTSIMATISIGEKLETS